MILSLLIYVPLGLLLPRTTARYYRLDKWLQTTS